MGKLLELMEEENNKLRGKTMKVTERNCEILKKSNLPTFIWGGKRGKYGFGIFRE